MADWGALVRGFQEGADFSQRFRRNSQLEKARDLDLEGGSYDMQARRANRRVRDPMSQSVLGKLDPSSVKDWEGALPDPFAFKLFDFIKSKVKKKKQAIPAAEITPTDAVSQSAEPMPAAPELPVNPYDAASPQDEEAAPEGYADGGSVDDEVKRRAKEYQSRTKSRVENASESVRGADRTATAAKTAEAPKGLLRRAINSKVGRAGGALAAGSAMMNQFDEGYDERIAKRFGFDDPTTAVGTEPSVGGFAKFLGKRALGYASDLGDVLTGGLASNFYQDQGEEAPQQAPVQEAAPAAPQRMALPTMNVRAKAASQRQAVRSEPQTVDFSQLEIDPSEVPDMKTDDWKRYRAELMDAARQSGNPEAVSRANDMVTEMQQKGFLNYAQQGLALQQAGNVRGAMSAYRAAYQYFPNGHDVEFGVHKGRIVGFGKDEKTGKVVPGTELVMDPERVGVLIENFKNPQAFRMWTKDWREFQHTQRKYNEVEKPLAQAQANALENRSEADILRAENAQLKAGQGSSGSGAAMRNAEHVFRQRVEMLGIQDEAQADYLASVMSQVKASNPQVPDNAIVQAIMQAQRDGTLKQRLQQLGIQ